MDERTGKVLGALYLLGLAVYAGVLLERRRREERERVREERRELDFQLRMLGGHVAEVCQRVGDVEARVGALEPSQVAQASPGASA